MKMFANIETGEIIAATLCPVLSNGTVHHIIRHNGTVVEIIGYRQDETISPVVLQRLNIAII